MQLLTLSKKILATSLLVSSLAFADNIGDITEHKGSGGIVRESGEVLATDLGVNVMQMDAIVDSIKAPFVEIGELAKGIGKTFISFGKGLLTPIKSLKMFGTAVLLSLIHI